jgi:hypothetical protein
VSSPELCTLVRRADLLRRAEIRRCRRLREQPRAIALADEVTDRLVSALLAPIAAYLDAPGRTPDAGRRLGEAFGLHDDAQATLCPAPAATGPC